ncbi:uncharacterized protein LOC122282383 [Carya illinoinensis]|uniref:uncharacterized protein LOC122282383 n=1 Tax=Carya illinoinensis TaxID=32201 RepID=UPI001C7289F8|nr:uncharacterized protein LOC122282383 [Carya illinoinensis]
MSFQELFSRGRGSKDTFITVNSIKVDICVFVFDIMFANGERNKHADIKIVDSQSCTKLNANVPSSNNHDLCILLCFNNFYKLIGIINYSQVEDIFGISSWYTKICQPDNLQRSKNHYSSR